MTSKVAGLRLKKDDRVAFALGGGGGWGDPRERDPERVRQDVVRQYVSRKAAAADYGVAAQCGPDCRLLDQPQTARLRGDGTSRMTLRIGIDVGGTFTDVTAFDDRTGEIAVRKYLSEPGAAGAGDRGDHGRARRRVWSRTPYPWSCTVRPRRSTRCWRARACAPVF